MEIGISRSSARERLARGGSRLWRSGSPDLVRERERLARGGGGCARRGRLGVARQELGRGQRVEVGKEKREREQSRCLTRVLEGKWFTKIFSVNRFPKFP